MREKVEAGRGEETRRRKRVCERREKRKKLWAGGENTEHLGRQSAGAAAVTAVATRMPSALQRLGLLKLKAAKGRWEERKKRKNRRLQGGDRPGTATLSGGNHVPPQAFAQTRYLYELPLACSVPHKLGRAPPAGFSFNLQRGGAVPVDSVCKRKYLALPAWYLRICRPACRWEVRQGAFSVSQPRGPIFLSELLQLCFPKAEMREILAYA